MDLYFSPLACSMASRIALYEAEAPARFVEVDSHTKRTLDGEDFHAVNPLGLVPAIRTDDGEILTENAAILQYIADSFPEARLAPRDSMARRVLCSAPIRIASASPGTSRSITFSVASGVTSRGANPVPPVVSTRSA